jgi:hypothetical protein
MQHAGGIAYGGGTVWLNLRVQKGKMPTTFPQLISSNRLRTSPVWILISAEKGEQSHEQEKNV